MSTLSMVERVARAIAGPDGWLAADERDRYLLRKTARIAIEAMREPTKSMTVAMGDYNTERSADRWCAAIDAALAEPNQP